MANRPYCDVAQSCWGSVTRGFTLEAHWKHERVPLDWGHNGFQVDAVMPPTDGRNLSRRHPTARAKAEQVFALVDAGKTRGEGSEASASASSGLVKMPSKCQLHRRSREFGHLPKSAHDRGVENFKRRIPHGFVTFVA